MIKIPGSMERFRELQTELNKDPENWERWYDLAEFHFIEKDYPSARNCVIRMLKFMPSEPERSLLLSFKTRRYLPLEFIIKIMDEEQ